MTTKQERGGQRAQETRSPTWETRAGNSWEHAGYLPGPGAGGQTNRCLSTQTEGAPLPQEGWHAGTEGRGLGEPKEQEVQEEGNVVKKEMSL